MKKLIFGLLSLVAFSVIALSPIAVLAQDAGDPLKEACSRPNAASSDVCRTYRNDAKGDKILGPNGIVTKIIQTLVFVVAAITVIAVIVGGLQYVLSGGDPNGTKQAKDTILYALIGLVVALFAQVIVSFVLSKL
jgi:hypothetical protein